MKTQDSVLIVSKGRASESPQVFTKEDINTQVPHTTTC